jgi:L-lactate dehydrogenase complex protein LldG
MVARPKREEGGAVSKEVVLGRVRAALRGNGASAPQARTIYPRIGLLSADERLRLFEERLHEYDARVVHCSEQGLREQIAQVLRDDGKTRMVHPAGIPAHWMDERISWTTDSNATTGQLSYSQIEGFDGVLTGATVAVADSGSIVLQHGPTEGRRALTLLPDYHLCVLFRDQIVETLPECIDRLKESATQPTTFISGPSATADIEMTRIKGVHGPRFLDVVLVS